MGPVLSVPLRSPTHYTVMKATITIPPGYSLLKPRTLKRRGDLIFMIGSDSRGRTILSWEEVMLLGPVTGGAMVIRPLPARRAGRGKPHSGPKGLILPDWPAPEGRRWLRPGEVTQGGDRYHYAYGSGSEPSILGVRVGSPMHSTRSPGLYRPGWHSRALGALPERSP